MTLPDLLFDGCIHVLDHPICPGILSSNALLMDARKCAATGKGPLIFAAMVGSYHDRGAVVVHQLLV